MNGNLATEPRLRARCIGKRFGGTVALSGVDLDIMPGEMLALVGANGAGKSTLVKIICGAQSTDEGEILVDGRPVAFATVGDALAAGIAVAHQQVAIIPTLTAAENIMLGQEPRRFGLIRHRRLVADARAIAERFGVDLPLDRECGELGIGENKILDILKALKSDPALLVLDEPTASLTLNESRKLFGFLRDLKVRERTWTMAVARYNAGPDNDPAQKKYVCGVLARMIASGFGIAAQLPLLKELIQGFNRAEVRTRDIHLVWQLQNLGLPACCFFGADVL